MPSSVPRNHYLKFRKPTKENRGPIPLFHARLYKRSACFEHSNFFKVNLSAARGTQRRAPSEDRRLGRAQKDPPRTNTPARPPHPPTSFLTATTLVYAIGAGITAAAGTRLALQLILVKGFKVYSFQLRGLKRVPYCYFSSLPPRVGIG